MPIVRVNIFNGSVPQIPRLFNVTADTYQDVITGLIQAGEKSGQIYNMQGKKLDSDSRVNLGEIQYITFSGDVIQNKLPIYDPKTKETFYIPYSDTMKVRDIYNYMIATNKYQYINGLISRGRQLNFDVDINVYPDILGHPIWLYQRQKN